ncbi:PcfB family protein [Butyrivibrio proteoclasticus]|uniref:PcfB family protein n=1 Tax=Butyrivibrio proteoclasticus TaxID=43305 RepID=UPI0006851217|nr:PcfB family protein [Butyrivibrio proteoclasticus]
MVNEQLTQEAIRFCYRGSKEVIHLSEKSMVYIMKLYNATIKPAKDRIFKDPQDCHGKMSVKKLIRKDEGATCVDISKTELRDFQKVAKRYGVDFAVVNHKNSDPQTYSIFFKARDQDAITDVIRYYTEKKLMKEQKPSLKEKIDHFKQKIAEGPKKVLNKVKERTR